MNLAVSNIAWPAQLDEYVLEKLPLLGVGGLEVAPTRVWPDWNIPTAGPEKLKRQLSGHGLRCSSLQAVLFGKPDLSLFGTFAQRRALVEHLKVVADLAGELGAGPVVLGAPKNRDRGALSVADAIKVAVEVFAELGPHYLRCGATLCIEPNPVEYQCNFITNAAEGIDLVKAVGAEGIGLHLDAAGMLLAGDDPERSVRAAGQTLCHVHVSEPNLGSFSTPHAGFHGRFAEALRAAEWKRWISIEMRSNDDAFQQIERAISYVRTVYTDV